MYKAINKINSNLNEIGISNTKKFTITTKGNNHFKDKVDNVNIE